MANCMCESGNCVFTNNKKGSHAVSRARMLLDILTERSEFVADLRYGSASGQRVSDLKTHQVALVAAACTLVLFVIL